MRNIELKSGRNLFIFHILPMFLAVIMMFGSFAELTVFSMFGDKSDSESEGIANNISCTGTVNSEIKYDDTLVATYEGKEISELQLLSHEKKELIATGIAGNVDYQWQILHPEETGLWADIYDATENTISVSAALTKNMTNEEGRAYIRCMATTEECTYVTDVVSIIICEEIKVEAPKYTAPGDGEEDIMLLADGDDHPEFVTVTIKYEKWENQYNLTTDEYELKYVGPAFSSYMATIQWGKSFKTTVSNPTIVGYDSYFGDETTASLSVEIDLTEVKDDVVFVVNYKPAVVKYEVHYYFQNIYDDLYTEDNSIKAPYIGEGYTGMPPVDGIETEVPGFTALYYQPDTIAADGSTVFEVYFERNYYLMEFDCDGGYGVHTIYVRHGTYVSIATPTKPGYIFQGWNLVKTENISTVPPSSTPIYKNGKLIGYNLTDNTIDEIPGEMPKYNTAYKALWTTTNTTYTVVYWAENANDGNYSYWDSVQVNKTSTSLVSGTDHSTIPTTIDNYQTFKTYFSYNSVKTIAEENARTDLFNGKVLVEGDGSTVVNVYFSRNTYILKFSLTTNNLGTFESPEQHKHTDGTCVCNKTHVHGDDCIKSLTCSKDVHTHTDECKADGCFICVITEHVHNQSCFSEDCEYADHEHTAACCLLEEHSHSTACYILSTGTWGNVVTNNNTIANIENSDNKASNGIVRYNSNYYYKINDSWYQISNLSNSSYSNSYWINVIVTECTKIAHSHTGVGCKYCDSPIGHKHTEECCLIEQHSHTIECYDPDNGYSVADDGDAGFEDYISNVSAPKVGYVYRYNYGSNYYYFYDGLTWYYLGRNTNLGLVTNGATWTNINNRLSVCNTISNLDCGLSIHTHGDGNCKYCIHEHTDACIDCGLIEHIHNSGCYVKEEHIHSDKCYSWSCGKEEHTHSSECCIKPINYTEGNYYYIEAKYEQTIADAWPTAENFTSKNLSQWNIEGVSNSAVSKRVTMTADLCNTTDSDRTKDVTGNTTSSSSKQTLYYMFESFNQTDTTTGEFRKLLNGVYYDCDTDYKQDVYSTATNWSQKSITGMIPVSNGVRYESSNTKVYFYYTRQRVSLSLYNVSQSIETISNLMYETKFADITHVVDGNTELLSGYEPPYPTTYEPGAYDFVKWFTTPECFPGTEVDWDNMTMPNVNYEIYAKWTPYIRNVTYYLTYAEIAKDNLWQPDPEDQINYPIKVPHGQLLGTTYNYIPTRGEDYDFIGWFYFDENGKKKFAPDSMKVNRDLELFAEWNSQIPTTYEIKYEAWTDKNGGYKIEDIADVLFGYSTAGKTTTFDAKGGKALYDKNSVYNDVHYQNNWFPEYSSHSILMEQESDLNTFTFRYFYKDKINYKIMYIDRATGEILGESGVLSTSKSVETVKFKPFKDYLPESYYIEKAIAYDPTDYSIPGNENHVQPENIIYFYYNEDKNHDPFRVEHWYQNVDDDGYTLMYTENGVANNGATVTAEPRNTSGFDHILSKAEMQSYYQDSQGNWQQNPVVYGQLTGKVTDHGLEIKLYYDRQKVDYTVKYIEFGSNPENVLFSETIGGSRFGSTVEAIAPVIYHKGELEYIYFDGLSSTQEQRTKSTIIRDKAENNEIIFYYNLKRIPVHYHAVCTVPDLDTLNGVSVSLQYVAKIDSNVNSTAMAGKGFTFEGWFYDESCTQPVPDSWIQGTTIYPETLVEDLDGTEHFYAKFEPQYGSLAITKSGVSSNDLSDHNFLFRIKGKDNNNKHIDLIISIEGNGTEDVLNVPIGDYTVTELTEWSWDYTATNASQNIAVAEGKKSDLTFDNTDQNPNWLYGEASLDNLFN